MCQTFYFCIRILIVYVANVYLINFFYHFVKWAHGTPCKTETRSCRLSEYCHCIGELVLNLFDCELYFFEKTINVKSKAGMNIMPNNQHLLESLTDFFFNLTISKTSQIRHPLQKKLLNLKLFILFYFVLFVSYVQCLMRYLFQ